MRASPSSGEFNFRLKWHAPLPGYKRSGVSHLPKLTILVAVLAGMVAHAESERERQAREDLERQLRLMVGTPPTKVKVEFVGLDQPNYELLEANFKLDGNSLRVADLKALNGDGDHLIFHGDVAPGEHSLESKFEFVNKSTAMMSIEAGYKWKVGSEVTFPAQSGIEVTIKVTPDLNERADIKSRITIKSPASVKMLAKLDDGSMPAPAPKPGTVPGVDAGSAMPDAGAGPAVAVVKGETAAEKAAAAAEAKKKAREDAVAAKQAAAEEKKRKADEAKAAKAEAAAEKKRAAEEAKAAKLAAAAEKKNGKQAEPVAAVEKQPEPMVAAFAEVDAGPAVVAAVLPGPDSVPTPVKKLEPVAAAPAEESGLPMPVLIGLGVAALGLVMFFAGRRKRS